MGQSFEGKVVIVTGATGGIGTETVKLFGSKGASLVLHGRSTEKLSDLEQFLIGAGVAKSKILPVQGQIELESTWKALVEGALKRFGRIDVLVNNAAVSSAPGCDPNGLQSLDYIMQVNVRAPYGLTLEAAPHLKKTHGNVVNISSDLAHRVFERAQPYCMSKAALNHMSRCAAVQLAADGVRVNVVAPGLTDTAFRTKQGLPAEAEKELLSSYSAQHIPLRRPGLPSEPAHLIVFVASQKNAGYVTGATLGVDGGLSTCHT